MSKEAMKLALEALNTTESDCGSRAWEREQEAITALREALAEQPAQQTCSCRWEGEVQVQQCTLHEAHVDAIHEWAERAKSAEHQFKNFHRLLCERFGYTHDERDWRRDQLSLIEWIAKRAEQPAQQEPVAWATQLGEYAHVRWGLKRPDYPMVYEFPLYTSLPARKPLTGQEAKAITYVGPVYAPDGLVIRSALAYRKELEAHRLDAIRKTEAAHGIKENT